MSHINRYYMIILTCNACEEAKTHSVGSETEPQYPVQASQEVRAVAVIDPEQLVHSEQVLGTKELRMRLDGFITINNY